MILFIAVIALALAIGFLLGGSLRRFEDLRLRWWGLVILGLGLQFVPLPNSRAGSDLVVRVVVLAASYGLLLVFALLNVRLHGMPLVLLGLALNVAVILPNGGMPVSESAVRRSGQEATLQLLIDERAAKHHLMTEDDVLTPLADVIAIPKPIGQIASIGDLFVYAGIAWLIVAAMRGRIPSMGRPSLGPYQGKHRSGGSHERAAAPDLRARATTWGSAP